MKIGGGSGRPHLFVDVLQPIHYLILEYIVEEAISSHDDHISLLYRKGSSLGI